MGQRLLHGVAGALLRALQSENEVGLIAKRRLNLFGAMTGHHHDSTRFEATCVVQYMGEHGPTGDGMQNLWKRRLHALALPGGKYDDVQHVGKSQ